MVRSASVTSVTREVAEYAIGGGGPRRVGSRADALADSSPGVDHRSRKALRAVRLVGRVAVLARHVARPTVVPDRIIRDDAHAVVRAVRQLRIGETLRTLESFAATTSLTGSVTWLTVIRICSRVIEVIANAQIRTVSCQPRIGPARRALAGSRPRASIAGKVTKDTPRGCGV